MGGALSLAPSSTIVQGSRSWTAAQLLALSERIGERLGGRLTPSSRVAIATADLGCFVAALLAARAQGAVAVPLTSGETADPRGLAGRLKDSEADILVADDGYRALFGERYAALGPSLGVAGAGTLHLGLRNGVSRPHPVGSALIVYTSGSMSRPKGVVLSERALACLLETNLRLSGWRQGDVFLAALPMSHVTGLLNVLGALGHRSSVVVSPSFMWPGKVIETCRAHRVTVTGLVPFLLGRLVRHPGFATLQALRLVVLSAAPIVANDMKVARAALPHAEFLNAYGLTEAFRSLALPSSEISARPTSIGVPVPGVEIELRDEDGVALAPSAERGVGWIRGPHVMTEYWKQPELTARVLSNGWLCTSDVLRRSPDGYFHFEGRLQETINRAGEKLAASVIEGAILERCPVQEAMAAAVEESGFDIVVFATPAPGASVTLQDIRDACAEDVPRSFLPTVLVLVDKLPRTQNGKLDRSAVRKIGVGALGAPLCAESCDAS